MARRDDIAGIAALAGLGMLMANRSAGNKPSPYDAEDMRMAEDTGPEEDPMEAANRRTERTLMPNERGAAGTSETVFPSQRTKPTTRAVNKPSYQGAGGSGGGRGPTAEELAAYRNQGSSRYPNIS